MREKSYIFTIDDNIRFLKEAERDDLPSLFDHPYMKMLLELHNLFGVKIQLNLFFEMEGFDLTMVSDRYRDEFREASSWLKLSFHSRLENVFPYIDSESDEVRRDAAMTNAEILRFAGEDSLARTTTVHYCAMTEGGVEELKKLGTRGLLGLYELPPNYRTSYRNTRDEVEKLCAGEIVFSHGVAYSRVDVILNLHPLQKIEELLLPYLSRDKVNIMIHEQYFYPDYKAYQKDFREKLSLAFSILSRAGYKSKFFEELI